MSSCQAHWSQRCCWVLFKLFYKLSFCSATIWVFFLKGNSNNIVLLARWVTLIFPLEAMWVVIFSMELLLVYSLVNGVGLLWLHEKLPDRIWWILWGWHHFHDWSWTRTMWGAPLPIFSGKAWLEISWHWWIPGTTWISVFIINRYVYHFCRISWKISTGCSL